MRYTATPSSFCTADPDKPRSTAHIVRHATNRCGLALEATVLVLVLFALLIVAVIASTMSTLRTMSADYEQARTFYAAEAAAEAALSQIEDRIKDGALTASEIATISPPDLKPFVYEQFKIEKVGLSEIETIKDGPYAGLYALTQNVEILAAASDASEAMSAIILAAKAQAIPLFQFGVFYDEDLEATNGPPMVFEGRVHSNGDIYLSSANAWYREAITTPGKVFHRRKDQNDVKDGVYINDEAGNEVALDFDSESLPGAEAFKKESCLKFDCRLKTDAFNVEPLKLPFPEGVDAYELLAPRDGSDGDGARSVKFAWNADTRVIADLRDPGPRPSVCGGGGGGGSERVAVLTIIRDAGRPVPDESTACDIFDWEFSEFYDGRERELKDVLNVDIEELNNWVGGDPDREMNLIYVEFILPPGGINDYPGTTRNQIYDGTLDPAIRVRDGTRLPNPLTIASEWPMYTLADYNVIAKQPAALVGDGITIQSSAWSDDQNRPSGSCVGVSENIPCSLYTSWVPTWNMKTAGETTVNAAVLAGHWATPCDWKEAACSEGYEDWYGGGIENFPRFLERWDDGSKVVFHYKGALISPFKSEKTEGTWNLTYYKPPQRDWSFDTDFRDPEKLPPGTPNVGVVLRAAFREAY